MSKNQNVVLVTGLSGAGKTTAMGILEDMGYYCIDGLPTSMVASFVKEIEKGTDSRFMKVAVATNLIDFPIYEREFSNTDCNLKVLFLESSSEELLRRYKFNRRNHPLLIQGIANSLSDAIDIEINEYATLKTNATIIIDTSLLNKQSLTTRLHRYFNVDDKPILSVSFISFGFKYGLPRDADLVFDVRFLKNPFWDDRLKTKNGNDKEVFDYVMDDPKTQTYIHKLKTFLDYSLEQYKDESKHHVSIAIGCTGGMHRSVSIVNWLFKEYRYEYTVFKDDRDIKEIPYD